MNAIDLSQYLLLVAELFMVKIKKSSNQNSFFRKTGLTQNSEVEADLVFIEGV